MGKIDIKIGEHNYSLLAQDSPEYMRTLCDYIETKLASYSRVSGFSEVDVALMSALELADEYFKTKKSADDLGLQVRACLADVKKAKSEAAELRRELTRLKKQ